jgi:hypothetical protein
MLIPKEAILGLDLIPPLKNIFSLGWYSIAAKKEAG